MARALGLLARLPWDAKTEAERAEGVMEGGDKCVSCFGTGRFQGKFGGPGWPSCPDCAGTTGITVEGGSGMYDVERYGREEVTRWMLEHGYATGHGDTIEDLLSELEWQATERGIKSAQNQGNKDRW